MASPADDFEPRSCLRQSPDGTRQTVDWDAFIVGLGSASPDMKPWFIQVLSDGTLEGAERGSEHERFLWELTSPPPGDDVIYGNALWDFPSRRVLDRSNAVWREMVAW